MTPRPRPTVLAPLLALAATCAACVGGPVLDEKRLVDLSHPFDQDTIYWPGAGGFEHERTSWGENESGAWYAAAAFRAPEHGGTHLDAPLHFASGGLAADEIPLSDLVGPARVIDVRAACDRDRDYRVSVDDVRAHEVAEGRLMPGTIVLVRTGWGRYWPDATRYLGASDPPDPADLHFPGLSVEAAELLVERSVTLVGIDTASLDPGTSQDFAAHRVLAAADVGGLENVHNLDRLPARGAVVIALPMKIAGGSGGPVRIVALLP